MTSTDPFSATDIDFLTQVHAEAKAESDLPPSPVPPVIAPTSAAAPSGGDVLLGKVREAYQGLHAQLQENQRLIQEGRDSIAAQRSRMRELAAVAYGSDEEQNFHHGKVEVHNDSCGALIDQVEQIRDNIYHNTGQAESLLVPFKNGVELLELRVRHVRAIEAMLPRMKEGIALQDRLLEADVLLEGLAKQLGVAI